MNNVTKAIIAPGRNDIVCAFEGGLAITNIAESKMNVQVVALKRGISKKLV